MRSSILKKVMSQNNSNASGYSLSVATIAQEIPFSIRFEWKNLNENSTSVVAHDIQRWNYDRVKDGDFPLNGVVQDFTLVEFPTGRASYPIKRPSTGIAFASHCFYQIGNTEKYYPYRAEQEQLQEAVMELARFLGATYRLAKVEVRVGAATWLLQKD